MGISQLIQLGDSRVYGPRLGSPTVEQPPDHFCYSPNILGEGGHAINKSELFETILAGWGVTLLW